MEQRSLVRALLDPERVYARLPTSLQHVACSAAGWRIEAGRYDSEFDRLLAEYTDRTYWPAEPLERARDRRIAEFVQQAADNVPYYRGQLRELGVHASEIRSLGDLAQLPTLQRRVIQRTPEAFRTPEIDDRALVTVHTSGTTGAGLRFATTRRAVKEQWAAWWRYRSWHGIVPGTGCALFTGRSLVPARQTEPPFWRYNVPGRQVAFDTYRMNSDTLPAYIDELRRRRLPWLHGYPSALALLAAHLIETGGELGYAVRWVTTGAENLLDHQRQLIQQAFGVRPRQHYGSTEASANVSECEEGRLHVDEDFSAVEFEPQPGASTYKIVGTNFTNPATPLIRYEMDDFVTLDESASCTCGRAGRLVVALDGRREDYVVLPDGTRVGRMDHCFKDMVSVREAQIHQAQLGEITVRIVRGEKYRADDEARVLAEIHKRIGEATTINVEYRDALPRSRNGKLRLVVSELPQGSVDSVITASRLD